MNTKLVFIKLLHTLIWIIYVLIIIYILYAGIVNKIDIYVYIAISSVILEGIILLIFKWRCPLTIIGEKYTDSKEVGFDIYLPKWLAKNNKAIFSTIFIFELLLITYRILKN